MAIIKDTARIAVLREAGRRLATVLDRVIATIKPGVTERELDALAERLIREGGDTPAFLGYQPWDAAKPYPATLCVSVNDAVVHGIPKDHALKEGDIVSLDIGLTHDGIIVDMAKTVPVGAIPDETVRLLAATERALMAGIAAARPDNRIGDIGHAIESVAIDEGFAVVEELGGHAVGNKVHEDPFIPNYGTPGKGQKLKEGMVLALEPIFNVGGREVEGTDDGYTIKTADGSLSAHFEHTILLTSESAEIITIA